MPAELVFPKSSTPGPTSAEGEGQIINGVLAKFGDTLVQRRAPGIVGGSAIGIAAPRGMINMDGVTYVVGNGVVKTRAVDGTLATLTGSIPGTDGVTLAFNNRVTGGSFTRDLVAVRETGGAYVLTSTTVSAYPDADLPTPNSVSFLGGFFVFTIADGRIFASQLNSTDINALSFTTAESSPDGLVRGFVFGNRFYACGTQTNEVYNNQGLQPFPLVVFPSVIPVGLLTGMAVAGFEQEWGGSPILVANDRTVREIQGGFSAVIISTEDVERFIRASTVSTLTAWVYRYGGHAMWVLGSDIGTWEFDTVSRQWTQRTSAGQAWWRAARSVRIGDDWVVGDRLAGTLGTIAPDVRTEFGTAVTWQASGRLKGFPARIALPDIELHFTKSNATVTAEFSLDGGVTYPDARTRSLATADRHPIRFNRLGLSSQHGLYVRLTISDDADFGFLGGSLQNVQARAA